MYSFPIWNQSVVPCPVLTVALWPAYGFLKRQDRWSGIHLSFRIFQRIFPQNFSTNGISLSFLWLSSQGQWPGGATRGVGCAGTGGPRGAIPRWRSGTVVVRRYPSSKVRYSSLALLEQPWRDTPRQGKRNPSKMVSVARAHQRAGTLKPYSEN